MGKKESTEVAKIRTGCRRRDEGTGVANVTPWNSKIKEVNGLRLRYICKSLL